MQLLQKKQFCYYVILKYKLYLYIHSECLKKSIEYLFCLRDMKQQRNIA